MSEDGILIGGVQHETNGFSPTLTRIADFRHYQYLAGDALLEELSGTGTEIGGALAEAARRKLRPVASLFAAATPSGKIPAEDYEAIVSALCDSAQRQRGTYHGVLMTLHGAMVAQDADEADALLLERLRIAVGPSIPIVATLDLHANVSRRLVDAADMLIGYRTFPHTDMAERGAEAVAALALLMSQSSRPAVAFHKLPLLAASDRQVTSAGTMKRIMDQLTRAARDPRITACSLLTGYPFADVAHLGMSLLVYGDSDYAAQIADRFAKEIWECREHFTSDLVPIDIAVERAARARRPVILVDSADNVGGGAPGDGTEILAAILQQQPGSAVVVLWDPGAAALAASTGVDRQFSGVVGAHTHAGNGRPVQIDGQIERVEQLRYQRTGSYMRGTWVDLGTTALVRSGSIRIVLTSHRLMPFDSDHLRALGIQPEHLDIIVVKSGSAWRAGFGELAGDVIQVDAPGVTTQRFDRLPYTKKRRKLFPIDRDARWP